MSRRQLQLVSVAACVALSAPPRALRAQGNEPPLVVPVPPASAVTVTADSFTSPDGVRRAYAVTRARGASGRAPVVLFANAGGTFVRTARSYQEWARLVTRRGFAAVLYEAPDADFSRTQEERERVGVATLDSLVRTLERNAARHAIDPAQLVVWAGSSQTTVGTPFALEGDRPVAGYVLYYGSGNARAPRSDVPVMLVRAGQDSPALNADMDSLVSRLTRVGTPLTVVHHPAGPHAFDIIDSTPVSAAIIEQTLDFVSQAVEPGYRASIVAGALLARASAAFAAGRWSDAVRLYRDVAASRPKDRIVKWRLGLAQLANAEPGEALASFDEARTLGQGGARDIGLPATRAALRVQNADRAVEWLNWALKAYPAIRAEVERDAELAPLLAHPRVRPPS